jgi:Phosphotransferase enzyme family
MRSLATDALGTEMFKVIVSRHLNSEVLLAPVGNSFVLPAVLVPKSSRVTPEISEGIFELSGVRTICLFSPELQKSTDEHSAAQYMVAEPIDPSCEPIGLRWISRDNLWSSLSSAEEARSAERALTTGDSYNAGTSHGNFARSGWFLELVLWVQKHLDRYGLTTTGKFRQLNCGPTFSLVRLETTGPAVWFKAAGETNLREFSITTSLANHFSIYVPTLIATLPAWNGWLTFEADGAVLDEESDITTWQVAARTLAQLQIESRKRAHALLGAGCRMIETAMLLDNIEPFFEVMAQLMTKQTTPSPPQLTTGALLTLAAQLKEVCVLLAEFNLPDTLGHMDFNPGNIIASPTSCVFVDWAEAYVGNPFYTFEYLREQLRRTHPNKKAWQAEVTTSYLDPWISFTSADEVARALEITPLVAVLAYALSNNTWQDSERLENPRIAGYFRSLVRRMHHEAQILEDKRQRCLC